MTLHPSLNPSAWGLSTADPRGDRSAPGMPLGRARHALAAALRRPGEGQLAGYIRLTEIDDEYRRLLTVFDIRVAVRSALLAAGLSAGTVADLQDGREVPECRLRDELQLRRSA